MSRKKYKSGEKFGSWTIVKPYTANKIAALCVCVCGTEKLVNRSHLSLGKSTKCLLCYKKQMKENPIQQTHGMSKIKEYMTWKSMRNRILNPKGRDAVHYKNIKICDRWLNSFENFISDMGFMPKDGNRYSIGRIDNMGDYCPQNCRWETDIQQANNTSRTHWITYKGQTKSMSDWARELNKSYYVIRSRITQYGWSIEDALEK